MADNSSVDPGPGPLRHPRPLTAAELHLQLEKEQEAVVNRLTRELSLLRAASNASVVSNASSTSASASGTIEPTAHWVDSSFSPPPSNLYRPTRHHRTSSSASARSLTAHAGSAVVSVAGGISGPVPVRPPPAGAGGALPLSRQNSTSRAGSPHPLPPPPHASLTTTTATTTTSSASIADHHQQQHQQQQQQQQQQQLPSPGILPGTPRYEETALRRAELDEVRRENEALRARVRELERRVREALAAGAGQQLEGAQQGMVPPERSRTVSAGTSRSAAENVVSSGGGGGGGGVGVPVDEEEVVVVEVVQVGESAAGRGSLL
ncbi:hypothetical protein VTK26DRAFT_4344 [Humicola hyalothermophila]